ncbi:uncharacterized protein LOC131218903 [Magnolia sinica]|uniref:uncharacterized protein LOC131218903 n=1 Tax=Magnolia sinica TaxID=86752 RepID=UPI0026588326|nr:uncharacterized protein LOC131218903 [Magnolia sinica]
MALAVGSTIPTKKYLISASHVLCCGESRRSNGLASSVLMKDVGRRSLLSILLLGSVTTVPEPDSKKALLQKYLKKSEENKGKYDKERLEEYYKRNYKDYFGFIEGSVKGKTELSESEKGILEWLQTNK